MLMNITIYVEADVSISKTEQKCLNKYQCYTTGMSTNIKTILEHIGGGKKLFFFVKLKQ